MRSHSHAMKLVVAVLVALAIGGGALYLGFSLAMGTTSGGCPTALLQGKLVAIDGTLAVESVPPGTVTRVVWPFGYSVGDDGGRLGLWRLFSVVAHEGDFVSTGGGSTTNDTAFIACGPVTIDLITPTFEPRQIPAPGSFTP